MHLLDLKTGRAWFALVIAASLVVLVTSSAPAAPTDSRAASALEAPEQPAVQESAPPLPTPPGDRLVTPGSELLITVWTGETIHVFTRVRVADNSDVLLPRLGRLNLADLTLAQGLDKITAAYRALYSQSSVELVPVVLQPPAAKPFGPGPVPPGRELEPEAPLTAVEPQPTPVPAAEVFASLPRFGADVFISSRLAASLARPGAAPLEAAEAPDAGSPLANVPVSPYYPLGPADVLKVQIWNLDDMRTEQQVTVTADGYITLPVLGKLVISGKTMAETEALITKRAAEFYSDPEIVLELIQQRVIDVYVVGEVMQPGKFSLPGNATLFTALYAAGGPAELGSYRRLRLLRQPDLSAQPQSQTEVDLYQYLMYGRRDADVMLQAGDTVFVPPVATEIGVAGAVRRPARYELLDTLSLAEALAMAGGLRPNAYAAGVEVWRAEANEMWHLLRADLGEAGERGRDLSLLDGDLVQVGSLVDRARNTVELLGPVQRPGVYEVTPGLTLAGLLKLAQGPTEAAYMQQGAVWRLNDDFDYELVRFSVREVLDGTGDVPLRPHDIVYLYTEADVQAPALVTVEGQVRNPGEFPFIAGMTVRELVMLAGGLLPGAYTERAEVLRLTPDQREAILPVALVTPAPGSQQRPGTTGVSPVEQERPEDLPLQRGDLLRVLAREDVTLPSQVHIDGYVRNPDTYERYQGMRVSDLIVAAGGLKADAADTVQYTSGRFAGPSHTRTLSLTTTPEGFAVEPDVLLADDDRVGVMGRADFTVVPKVVSVQGEVCKPGTYALRLEQDEAAKADTIHDLIQRAGGLTEKANPRGMILYRLMEEVLPTARQDDLSYVVNLLNREAGQTSAALTEGQQGQILAESTAKQLGGLMGIEGGALLVVPPRRIDISSWIKAVPIDGADIMQTEGRTGNLKLHHGDILRVPKAVDFVTVIGSVSSPGAVTFTPELSPYSYVDKAGGALPDASLGRLIVVRANGAASPANKIKAVEAGDVVIVPSQHMFRTERLKSRWSDTLKQLIAIATAAILF